MHVQRIINHQTAVSSIRQLLYDRRFFTVQHLFHLLLHFQSQHVKTTDCQHKCFSLTVHFPVIHTHMIQFPETFLKILIFNLLFLTHIGQLFFLPPKLLCRYQLFPDIQFFCHFFCLRFPLADLHPVPDIDDSKHDNYSRDQRIPRTRQHTQKQDTGTYNCHNFQWMHSPPGCRHFFCRFFFHFIHVPVL